MILANLLVGISTMLVCLIVQAAVSFWSVRYYVRQSSSAAAPRKFIASIRPLLISMLAMIAGNFVQIALWGILFLLLGELDELYEAIYHSAVNFASLGYGDFVMSKTRKLLGPLEAVNGVVMLGMTSAALVVILQQVIKDQREEIIDPARQINGRDGGSR
jgi:CHASE3 domain sensor protein